MQEKKKFGISAEQLKVLAIVFMLSDHLWASVVPGNNWMTYVGRMAFPIFAFQIAEGYVRTSDVKKYAKRLFFFALVSEIPFNLFYIGSPIFPFHQNVLFTLLLGLLAICNIDGLRKAKSFKKGLSCTAWLLLILLGSVAGFPDYGLRGVLTVVAFYVFRNFRFAWMGQLISMILLNIVTFQGQTIPVSMFGREWDFTTQGFAVGALLFIWLYRGEKRRKSKALQYGFYAFYPLHMLVLYLVRRYFL